MDTFGQDQLKEQMSIAEFMDMSAFDEKFEIEIENDYISNIYHIEDKYLVPVLNGGYRELYDYCSRYLIHPDDAEYDKLMDPDKIVKNFEESEEKGVIKAEFREKLVDGSYRWVQYVGITGTDNGVPEGKMYFYVYDIQNQKNRIEGIDKGSQYKRNRDPITGLRKREEFISAIKERVADSEETWCCVAIDVQHFKVFNTWFGHEKGDYLLSRIGSFLMEIEEREAAVAAYFGRDNFAAFIRYDRSKINEIYEGIRGLISYYSNTTGFLPAIGVVRLEAGDEVSLEIYDNARIAVEEAKKVHTDRICYFDSTEYEKTRKSFELLSDFQHALDNDEITFHIQPQCRITDGRIVGAEALVRWYRNDGTRISPAYFIPLLESYGFITELDKRVWECVCRWIRSLIDRNITPLPVSVNVSQIDLLTIDVAEYLNKLTEKYDVRPELIKVEITESAYAENYDSISDTIERLKSKGFAVFLDDFGEGYSSLNMLDKINVDLIKLDMLFMKKENSLGRKGAGIVEAIFGMTKALELPVIVEGVEDASQIRFLDSIGLKYAQGYYFYKPMSIEEFEVLLTEGTNIDFGGIEVATSDLFRAQEFLQENMFTESTLNRILGAVAYYTLDGKDLTITRFNEPFRSAIGDSNMDSRIENIQNYVVSLDHPALYAALERAEQDAIEGGKCEVRFYKSDGSVFWFHMQFYFLKNYGESKLYFGQVKDVTEQREQSIHFFDVLRKQSDVTMRIELDKNVIQYVTGDNTLYQVELPSIELDHSVYETAQNRIEREADRRAFLEFFDADRLREAYRKAIYHEVLDIDFKLQNKSEPVEFSTYYIRHNRDESLIVYAFAKKRDREIMSRDPLTGLKNRYAYNEMLSMLEEHSSNNDRLIVFSIDVNGLKSVNDTKGHLAGDEMIRAVAGGISEVMSPYGSGFRTGGDEFAAFVYGDRNLAEYLQNELHFVLSKWSGTMVDSVSASCGYASFDEFNDAGIMDLIKMADIRMYRAKSQYYQKRGIDRRIQQVAFNALCESYTKILKVDLTEDRYEIIRAEESELRAEKGYAGTISTWLTEFARRDQVHPDDKEYYSKYTSIDYLREHFRSGNRHYTLYYRRRINDEFTKVMLEIIPAPDYSADNQKTFLYVKEIRDIDE